MGDQLRLSDIRSTLFQFQNQFQYLEKLPDNVGFMVTALDGKVSVTVTDILFQAVNPAAQELTEQGSKLLDSVNAILTTEFPGEEFTVQLQESPYAESLRQSVRAYLSAEQDYQASFGGPRERVLEQIKCAQQSVTKAMENFNHDAERFIYEHGKRDFRSVVTEVAGESKLADEYLLAQNRAKDQGRDLSR